MKNILYILIASFILFVSCDPNAGIYEELTDLDVPYNGEIDYTLIEDDYDDIEYYALKDAMNANDSTFAYLVSSSMALNDIITASDYIPAIIPNHFPAYNEKSVARITFNMVDSTRIDYSDVGFVIGDYEFVSSDYDTWGTGLGTPGAFNNFTLDYPPSDYVPGFVKTTFSSYKPMNGDYIEITYKFKYADIPNPIDSTDLYTYNGTDWLENNAVTSTGVRLIDGDYAAMDIKDKTFTDLAQADHYLPIYLKVLFPYAMENEIQYVKFKANSTFLSDQYTFDGNVWNKTVEVFAKTEQFVHTGEYWAFDPTVKFTMVSSDYMLIVEEDIFIDTYGTAGYYYGASSYYNNFDLRISKRVDVDPDTFTGLTEEEANAIILERLLDGLEILLQKKYPEATPQVNGVDVHYLVTYATYNNDYSRGLYVVDFQCTGSAPAQFELVEGPTSLN